MTVVVFGIDALDPDLVDSNEHPNLTLEEYDRIDTIESAAGEPSTHELWPTIITGLAPDQHGLQLDDGVAWENPALDIGSSIADVVLPDSLQTKIGSWILTNTNADAFRTPATYYEENGLSTVFDSYESKAIGIPNYVIDPDEEDREHQLRRRLGDLFERDPEATGGHRSTDPEQFYELCMEMSMVRIARLRRALRSRQYELVFGYTSGLDLIGHVSYDQRALQRHAYDELNEFVGELSSDLHAGDELLLISDHGLQDGLHTDEAMVASTDEQLVERIDSVLDVRGAIEQELDDESHTVNGRSFRGSDDPSQTDRVQKQLEDLGYL
ncbi:alkaline phosphatase family protein [Halopiger thermotolerans]